MAITRSETTSKNVLDEALLQTVLGGFSGGMTDEEIQKYAEALLTPIKNAELEAAQQEYEATRLGREQEIENLAVQLADAISKQEQSYTQNRAALETAALARGMGRSSYLLDTEAALSQALSETIRQMSSENTRQTAQIQNQLTLAAQQNAQTQGRVNTDYATQLAAKVQELKEAQRQERNQNYMSAVSSAMGSNSVTMTNPDWIDPSQVRPATAVDDSGGSGGGSYRKKTTTTDTTKFISPLSNVAIVKGDGGGTDKNVKTNLTK